MIHAICDFCGADSGRTGTLITMTPFQNFARHHTDSEPYGGVGTKRSFVMCRDCMKAHNMPNPYETYTGITDQSLKYEKCLDNYSDLDLIKDHEDDNK